MPTGLLLSDLQGDQDVVAAYLLMMQELLTIVPSSDRQFEDLLRDIQNSRASVMYSIRLMTNLTTAIAAAPTISVLRNKSSSGC